MANGNFIVQNGLQIGPLTIDAATGSINTVGNITTTGTVTTFINEIVTGTEAVYGQLSANAGIGSSSTSTGTFVVTGGTGITGDVFVGGNVHTTGTAYLKIPAGTTAQRPGSANVQLGMIRYNSSISSFEGYGAGSAWSSLGGVKSVDGYATITAEAFAGAGDDVLRFYSGSTGSQVQVAWASAANVSILPTTTSTSSTTGALQVAGGAGIAGALYTGGAAVHGGNIVAGSGTASSSTTTGALVVVGGLGVTGAANFGANVNISGNLSVTGQSVSIGSSSLSIQDPIVNLHTPSDLTSLTSNDLQDIGIKVHYYDTSDSAAFFGRANDTGFFEWYSRGTDAGNVFTGTAYGTIKTGEYVAANTTASTSTTTGALRVAGGAGIAGAVYIGGNGTNAIVHTGHIVPSANVSYNLGSATAWYSTFYGKATQAQYADLAENYQADKAYAPGTVVMFGGAAEVTVADADTTAVAGVVSTNPAHLMNGSLTGANVVPLALQGRVPCMVIGPVKKGDMMVSAGFGYAKPSATPGVGQVIGKALQDVAFAGKAVIEVVVGRV